MRRSSGARVQRHAMERGADAAAGEQRLVVAGDHSGVAPVGGGDLPGTKMALEEGADRIPVRRDDCVRAGAGRLPDRAGCGRGDQVPRTPRGRRARVRRRRPRSSPAARSRRRASTSPATTAQRSARVLEQAAAAGGFATAGWRRFARKAWRSPRESRRRQARRLRMRRTNEGSGTRWYGSSSRRWWRS